MSIRAATRYDYIVVGAGSAGCVLAARLSQRPGCRVLLIEAGGSDRRTEVAIPAAFSKLFRTPLDWGYQTEPQTGASGRRLYWPRGKMLGGCSSMNAMIYIRGHRTDFDEWERLAGPGWGFSEVLPFFKRSQHQERGESAFHGVGGPLFVSDLRTKNPLSTAFVDACGQVGIPPNPDFNGPEQDGAGFYQVTQRRGSRCSTVAFLDAAQNRQNLVVRTGCHVSRILFEGTRAVGVEVLVGDERIVERAEREVIISAGTINTPQVLMLSGIGPSTQLQDLGIPIVAASEEVGKNLQDHLLLSTTYVCSKPVSLASAESPLNLLRYLLLRRGPLTSNVAEAGAFVRSRPGLKAPDLQVLFGPAYYIEHGFTRPKGHGFTIATSLLRPESRGHIRLRSREPQRGPIIEPGYLQSDADLQRMVEGLRLARRIAAAPALVPLAHGEHLPGKALQRDDELADFVRRTAETLYHPVGTCRMGKDAASVVDPELRVRGVHGLRVVDASVMPVIVGGNTNAATIMIAEKAAALL